MFTEKDEFLDALDIDEIHENCNWYDLSEEVIDLIENYNEAYEWLILASNKGDYDAQCALGLLYYHGSETLHIKISYEKSMEWFVKSSESGSTAAAELLKLFFSKNNTNKKRGINNNSIENNSFYAKITEKYHEDIIVNGFAEAQFNLGIKYLEKNTQDTKKAIKHFRKASDQGHIESQFSLGVLYQQEGLLQDNKEALRFYLKAAKQGFSLAQRDLGAMYRNGKGTIKDKKESFKWFKKAAIQGEDWSQYYIASMYIRGEGNLQDYHEAFKWCYRSAVQGNKSAQYNLGVMYDNGEGVSEDKEKAFEWWQKSANQDYQEAQYELGLMYSKGVGVSKNITQAKYWIKKATKGRNIEIKKEAEFLWSDLTLSKNNTTSKNIELISNKNNTTRTAKSKANHHVQNNPKVSANSKYLNHELKGSIAGIRANSEILNQTMSEENFRQTKDNLIESTDRLEKRMKSLDYLSELDEHKENLKTKKINLKKALEDILKDPDFNQKHKNIILTEDISEDDFLIANKGLFEICLTNILNNAIDFNIDDKSIFIDLKKTDKYIRLKILDKGTGIPVNMT